MKYVTRAIITVQDPWGNYVTMGGEVVHEVERKPLQTGLVDQYGTMIWRVPEPLQIGFVVKGRP